MHFINTTTTATKKIFVFGQREVISLC